MLLDRYFRVQVIDQVQTLPLANFGISVVTDYRLGILVMIQGDLYLYAGHSHGTFTASWSEFTWSYPAVTTRKTASLDSTVSDWYPQILSPLLSSPRLYTGAEARAMSHGTRRDPNTVLIPSHIPPEVQRTKLPSTLILWCLVSASSSSQHWMPLRKHCSRISPHKTIKNNLRNVVQMNYPHRKANSHITPRSKTIRIKEPIQPYSQPLNPCGALFTFPSVVSHRQPRDGWFLCLWVTTITRPSREN